MATVVSRLLLNSVLLKGSRRLSGLQAAPIFNRVSCSKFKCVSFSANHWQWRTLCGKRWFSSAADGKESDGEGEGEGEGGEEGGSEGGGERGEEEEAGEEDGEGLGLDMLRHHAIAPINIPDHFPEVPVLPVTRNPVFPRFVKMLEVSAGERVMGRVCVKMNAFQQIYDKDLIKLIRQRVKLMQPYAGAFLKKDDK